MNENPEPPLDSYKHFSATNEQKERLIRKVSMLMPIIIVLVYPAMYFEHKFSVGWDSLHRTLSKIFLIAEVGLLATFITLMLVIKREYPDKIRHVNKILISFLIIFASFNIVIYSIIFL
ncbi:MAG: hypothetical protein ACFFCS_15395 [Candidatus Hodarchaeota archaeon]